MIHSAMIHLAVIRAGEPRSHMNVASLQPVLAYPSISIITS